MWWGGLMRDTLKFTWMEFSGSLGDLGLFIPLVVGVTISCGLDMGTVLILAGLMNILTGWIFRQPIPVQPMKAIAAVAIAEGLTRGELISSGILIGVILVVFSGVIDYVNRYIPRAVVRGIQLGVGLKLAAKGAAWIGALPVVGWNSLMVSIGLVIILLIFYNQKQPVLLYIFAAGFILLYFDHPEVYASGSMLWGGIRFDWPVKAVWLSGFYKGALPQLPLTVLNSVVALCALSEEYFPNRGVNPRKVAASVGLMNLLCVPFGGIPMCHGAGGLAAQYRFGARTGGSVIILGVMKILVGILFGGALLGLLDSYPMAVLAPMLMIAGLQLAKSSSDVLGDVRGMMIVLVTAAFILGLNTFVGFLAGLALACVYEVSSKKQA